MSQNKIISGLREGYEDLGVNVHHKCVLRRKQADHPQFCSLYTPSFSSCLTSAYTSSQFCVCFPRSGVRRDEDYVVVVYGCPLDPRPPPIYYRLVGNAFCSLFSASMHRVRDRARLHLAGNFGLPNSSRFLIKLPSFKCVRSFDWKSSGRRVEKLACKRCSNVYVICMKPEGVQ